MKGPRRSTTVQFVRRLARLSALSLLVIARPAFADPWYEHYLNGEQALDNEEWVLAVEELNAAIERKGDSGARVRSYGMNVIAYFPYLKLGIAYHHLGQHDAALQAFETESRLGAITESDRARSQLERYRLLAEAARLEASREERERIRQIVEQSIHRAQDLSDQGLWDEGVSALDAALAVAPDDAEALEVMQKLRESLAQHERDLERSRQISKLVADGKALVDAGRYSEASSLFRQAQFLEPSPEFQALLDDARGGLLAELEGNREFDSWMTAVTTFLQEAEQFEIAGQPAAALDRLQSVLVLEPSNPRALEIQRRLLEAMRQTQAEDARLDTIRKLLDEAGSKIAAGSAEEALGAANRVLALDSGNSAALAYVAQAYGVISRKLLGPSPRGNIPPAVRFVDQRGEADDGVLVQMTDQPDFRLNGVIIDDSPVDVVARDQNDEVLEMDLDSQPLGDIVITEFSIRSSLAPGRSTFRILATDSENLTSSSEYVVLYARPYYRAPWFFAAFLALVSAIGVGSLARRTTRRRQLRTRRFNPYVAGSPVIDENMFFGRRELVDRILQTIHNNSLLIYGERRIGKTSIQHQLRKRLQDLDDPEYDFHPVYIDLQGTPENQFFRTIAQDISEQLKPLLEGLSLGEASSGEYTYRDFIAELRAALRVLQSRTTKKVRLVLLIDEVDELNDYDPRINQKLRSLFMKNFAENMVALVSGVEIKKHWEREGSPWYNFFEEIEVTPLDPREARELIERPIRGMFRLESGVVEKIMSLTAGKPYLIQKLCISLVTRLHEQHRRKITVADVEAVAGSGGT